MEFRPKEDNEVIKIRATDITAVVLVVVIGFTSPWPPLRAEETLSTAEVG